MKGTMLIFAIDEPMVVRELEGEPPTLPWLKEGIGGGYLEVVPHWTSIKVDGKEHRCWAFCDEDGKLKQLPVNNLATEIWDKCMRRTVGCGCGPDYLVGSIAVVYGDPEFMEAL